jgi:hypothetical protein
MHLRPLREVVSTSVCAHWIYELVRDLMQTGRQALLRVRQGIRFGGQLQGSPSRRHGCDLPRRIAVTASDRSHRD